MATNRNGNGGRSKISSHRNASHPHLSIKERVWDVAGDSEPVAGLVIIHGGSWHSGWFGELGDLLSSESRRIRVSAPDLPSHGLSDDVVPPYRTHVPDFGEHANEVGAAVSRARSALPEGCKVFLLGESMGGLVALHALVSNDKNTLSVDGLLLCGAVVEPASEVIPPPAVFQVLRLLAWFFPTMGVPGAAIGGKTFDEAFGDPTIGAIARADPLVTEEAPPRIGFGLSFLAARDRVVKEAPEAITVDKVGTLSYFMYLYVPSLPRELSII